MSIFKKQHGTLVPIHADNANTRDWLILLEVATIIGHQRDKLRVALVTQERKVVKKRSFFGRPEHFLVLDGYDPRIHAIYFCPQLYRKEAGELVALSGPEIGQLMAQALQSGAIEKSPWYAPSDHAPEDSVISTSPQLELDSLVVDLPKSKPARPATLVSVAMPDRQKDGREQ